MMTMLLPFQPPKRNPTQPNERGGGNGASASAKEPVGASTHFRLTVSSLFVFLFSLLWLSPGLKGLFLFIYSILSNHLIFERRRFDSGAPVAKVDGFVIFFGHFIRFPHFEGVANKLLPDSGGMDALVR